MNAGTLLAAISITSLVWGLRPLRAALSLTSKLPNPIIWIFSPLAKVSSTVSTNASIAAVACFFCSPDFSATFEINYDLLINSLPPLLSSGYPLHLLNITI